MPISLVIVESPAKARTISGFLGSDYVVESSIGHVRDLPHGASEVPAAYKGEKWANLGVDVDNDFKPLYVVTGRAKEQVKHLKALLKDADELFLATDEDREGEAIAWHLLEVLNPTVPVKRMVFHEITEKAIEEAIQAPRELDRRLVDAQEARRIFDRLYGYEVSPVLWRKIKPRLSAGRVQSVATRLIVERERERIAFRSASYWGLDGAFGGERPFGASMISMDDQRVATGRDFDDLGELAKDAVVLDQALAQHLATDLESKPFTVRSVEPKPYRRRPAAPFITSTLQQEAGRKFSFSSARTMSAAQRLYENGYITYMRTDSTTLSADALSAARQLIRDRYGASNLPDEPRQFNKKVKNAQEAHEAIRPAGETWRLPDAVASEVNGDEARVYDLIWRRTVASQMVDATGQTVTIRLSAESFEGQSVVFSTSGTVISSPGFRLAYVEETDAANEDDRERQLPDLSEGDVVVAESLEAKGHETSPPARFTEASLVRRLEELGVGRPSTYASIMETIQARGYVWKKGSALVPAFTAFATVSLMEDHFPQLVDYALTARMEDDLDEIANGEREATPWLGNFYFGGPREGGEALPGLRTLVSEENLAEIDPREVNSIPIGVDENGEMVVARVGKFGPYLKRGEDTVSVPDDIPPDELTIDRAVELLEAPSEERILGADPDSGIDIIAKPGRFGPYVAVGNPADGQPKPRTASLFKSMSLDTVTVADALKLLSLPRSVGADPSDGVDITVQNGRYGPYLKKEKDSRSLETEEQLFTLTLEEALVVLAQPKTRRGQQAKPPLREMGDDPVSGKPVVMKDGRFGPYVTDGEINASLRKGDDVETLTLDRAAELLQIRRDAGPAKKRGKKKAAAKKKSKKKAASKKKASGKKKAAAKKKADPSGALAGALEKLEAALGDGN